MRDLNKFMGGALNEKLEQALMEVADNVLDINYPAKGKRKIVVTITVDPDEQRDIAKASLDVKTTLVNRKPFEQRLLFNRDNMGRAGVAELNSADPNQLELTVNDEGTTEVKSNTGIDLLQRV